MSFSRGRVSCYRAAIHAEITAALQTIRAKKTKAETWKRTAGTIGPCGAAEVRAALTWRVKGPHQANVTTVKFEPLFELNIRATRGLHFHLYGH